MWSMRISLFTREALEELSEVTAIPYVELVAWSRWILRNRKRRKRISDARKISRKEHALATLALLEEFQEIRSRKEKEEE